MVVPRSTGRGTTLLLLAVVVALVFVASGLLAARNRLTKPHGGFGSDTDAAVTVVRIVDGDTVVLAMGDGEHVVRLLGIDTPESVSTRTPIQCFGQEATAALAAVLPPGTPVEVGRDTELRDHYDRLLLHVARSEDGLRVNRWLIEQGYANAVSYPPNTLLRSEFAAAERQARAEQRGLWAQCDGPDQPLDPP